MVGHQEMAEMVPNDQQMEIPGNYNSHGQMADNEGSNYENRVHEHNGQWRQSLRPFMPFHSAKTTSPSPSIAVVIFKNLGHASLG